MILVTKTLELEVTGAVDLFESADNVTDALIELEESYEALKDSTVSVDKSTSSVTIEVTLEAGSFEEADTAGEACIRAAIHTAGGHTPEWNAAETTTIRKNSELICA